MRGGHGVILGANERVQNLDIEVLSDHWYVLRKATFDYLHRDGIWTREVREAYDRGNGVVILLHDPDAGTVLLTRQFRLPIFLNGHPDGMLIEAAAGSSNTLNEYTTKKKKKKKKNNNNKKQHHPPWPVLLTGCASAM